MATFLSNWLWPLLLLAGCSGDAEQDKATKAGENQAAAVQLLEEQAARAMIGILSDPQSARYSAVRRGSGGAICGQVNGKDANGNYTGGRPFLVTSDGVGIVSEDARIRFEDPNDPFPDLYLRWCATPEELQRVHPAISQAAENAAQAQVEAEAEPMAPLPFESAPLPVPPLTAEPAPPTTDSSVPVSPSARRVEPTKAPPSEGEESFFNAVRRRGG